jgi:low temperature requirement protein LtrA
LFFDLFFVVASINLTHLVQNDPSAHGVFTFFLYYTFFFKYWIQYTV